MIPGRIDHADAVVREPSRLLEQEALGLEGQTLAIKEISGDQESMDILPDRKIHRAPKRLSGCLSKPVTHRLGAPRERCVQMDIGDVYETHEPR